MSKAASMEFEFACDIYLYDIEPRVRETTLEQKRYCTESTLKPYFQSAPAGDIDAKAVIDWGGELPIGLPYLHARVHGPVPLIAARLKHAGETVTHRYIHLIPDAERAIASELDEVMGHDMQA